MAPSPVGLGTPTPHPFDVSISPRLQPPPIENFWLHHCLLWIDHHLTADTHLTV